MPLSQKRVSSFHVFRQCLFIRTFTSIGFFLRRRVQKLLMATERVLVGRNAHGLHALAMAEA